MKIRVITNLGSVEAATINDAFRESTSTDLQKNLTDTLHCCKHNSIDYIQESRRVNFTMDNNHFLNAWNPWNGRSFRYLKSII